MNKIIISTMAALLTLIVGSASATDKLTVSGIKMNAGTVKTVEVALDAEADKYAGLQFDVVLPDGVTLLAESLVGTQASDMIVSREVQTDGSVRIIVFSPSLKMAQAGSVMALQLKADKKAKAGDYELRLANIVLSDSEGNTVRPDATVSTITVAVPVTVTAKALTRTYGEENAPLDYDVSENYTDGTPTISCEATAASPAGTYDIVVGKGTIAADTVTLVNATLAITKAPLTVSVADAEREQGQENPTFAISYSGWKNDDTESVLRKQPTATTEATKKSPVGDYAIVLSGGEADNYELIYVEGKLTVTVPSAIAEPRAVGEILNVYDMKGRKVRCRAGMLKSLPKGVYIVNGKKMVTPLTSGT